jgi:uncharacterized protein YbcI
MSSSEQPPASDSEVEDRHRRDMLQEISRAMVKLYREQFGRGPETVWTRYSGPDALLCVLGNSLTPVERSMLQIGEDQRVREIRTMFQHTTEPQFRTEVERITGRHERHGRPQ